MPAPEPSLQHIQRSRDAPIVRTLSEVVFTSAESEIDRARLKAAASAHSGDWLNAPPIASIGLQLSDEDIRLSVTQRLGVKACSPYTCACGKSVDARGLHGLSCKRSMARHQRQSMVNDIIWRAVKRAKSSCSQGINRSCFPERQETGWCHAYTMVKGPSTGVGRHHSRYVCDVAHPVNIR